MINAQKRRSIQSEFTTEADLVESFMQVLSFGGAGWKIKDITTEWNHKAGYVDVLTRTDSGKLIAFEAKLENWKSAFHQAYRNCSYANQVYVLMPAEKIHLPLSHRDEFELYGIGLCSFQNGKIKVHIRAKEQIGLLGWIRKQAHAYFDEERNESESKVCRSRSSVLSAE